ncbi:hypothetical protein [Humibacter albus]|jgi:hypothetical protein|uniref:hypothetical protein n=1 Tax=Humibacter albus TaxID=427754 RepID=UPI0003B7ABE2|nr:hypothetical protein [Humibacter albus]
MSESLKNSSRVAEQSSATTTPRRKRPSRAKARPILDARAKMLSAFPWAENLPYDDQQRFADELAHHPRDLPNGQLEALILAWKQRARRAA